MEGSQAWAREIGEDYISQLIMAFWSDIYGSIGK